MDKLAPLVLKTVTAAPIQRPAPCASSPTSSTSKNSAFHVLKEPSTMMTLAPARNAMPVVPLATIKPHVTFALRALVKLTRFRDFAK